MEAMSNSRPNVVLIVADDLGYGDTSCYGATMIKTPNIDRLAAQGMKFIDAHAAASLCSPSRYGLLTGRSPWRLHKKGNGYRVKAGQATLGSVFQSQGYKSAAIGKWHLGYSSNWNKLPITGPLEVGFDYHFGVPQNHNDSTRAFIENHDIVGRIPGEDYRIVDGQDFPDGLAEPRVEDQVDTTLTNKVVQFIRDNAEDPFFVYFTPCALAHARNASSRVSRDQSSWLVGRLRPGTGFARRKIVETLEDLNLTENTLLIFTSDNGGSPKDFKGTNKMHLNLADDSGDIRVKFKTAKEDARKMGHMTNGQWHDGKGHPHEGGHRIPFIARWPNKIAPGVVSDTTFCLTDIMATAAQLINVDVPRRRGRRFDQLASGTTGGKSFRCGRSRSFLCKVTARTLPLQSVPVAGK